MTITVCTFFGMYLIAMLIWQGGFLNPQQFLDLFNNNAYLLIIACGLTMVMISGGIDISGGGITALVTMVCVVYLEDHGGTVMGSMLIALGIGLAFGLIHGILVAYFEIQPFIVTLAGMFLARGMITIVSIAPRTASQEAFLKLKHARVTLPGIGYYGKSGNFIPAQIEPGVIAAIAIVIIVAVILKWTRFGRNLYAIGGNSHSALTLGINVKRTKFFAYLFAGLLSGIGGYVYLLHTGAGDAANAAQAEMQAIVQYHRRDLIDRRSWKCDRYAFWHAFFKDHYKYRNRFGADKTILSKHYDRSYAVLLYSASEFDPCRT